tara:strand:+ start:1310 stop:1798 length:489 start_codon:yes stop_codon:yes gene_type:complete
MTTSNQIGLTIFGVAGVPATNNLAGMEALTFVQLKGTQMLPSFGVTHANIDVSDLGTGFTSGVKGAATGNDSTFTFHGDGTDTGIATAITAANAQSGLYTLKIVRGTGADSGDGPAPATGDVVSYAQGYLHTFALNPKDDSSFEGGTINFKQNNFTVDGTQT